MGFRKSEVEDLIGGAIFTMGMFLAYSIVSLIYHVIGGI